MQYQETVVPAGTGLHEENLHMASGLRNAQLNSIITTNFNSVGGNFIGTLDGSDSPGWGVGLRAAGAASWNPVMIVPMTPSVSIVAFTGIAVGFPTTFRVRIRMTGTDQFGNYQEEITPWISKTMTEAVGIGANPGQWLLVNMSKVFATVDECYVMTGNVISLGNPSTAEIGRHTIIDPALAANFAITDHPGDPIWEGVKGAAIAATALDFAGTWANWGIGTPLRIGPYGPNTPFASPEILGAMGVILREHTTPTVLNTTARLPARGQLAVAGVAPTTGVCVGRSAAGFQGTPHKFGFFSNDSWGTKIAGIGLSGSSNRGGGLAVTYAQAGEDDLQLSSIIRTTLGTRRGNNATKAYRD